MAHLPMSGTKVPPPNNDVRITHKRTAEKLGVPVGTVVSWDKAHPRP